MRIKSLWFSLGLGLFVLGDIVFFSNCIAPGDSQPPQIVEKGHGAFGISAHTAAITLPIEGGLYYRHGLGDGLDFGVRFHNWVNLVGGVADLRGYLPGGRVIGKMAAGVYADGEKRLWYAAPSLLRSRSKTYLGIKLNMATSNDGTLRDWTAGGEVNHVPYYAGIGPSLVGGFAVGKRLKLLGGYEAGFYALSKSHMWWPILQAEVGVGYQF